MFTISSQYFNRQPQGGSMSVLTNVFSLVNMEGSLNLDQLFSGEPVAPANLEISHFAANRRVSFNAGEVHQLIVERMATGADLRAYVSSGGHIPEEIGISILMNNKREAVVGRYKTVAREFILLTVTHCGGGLTLTGSTVNTETVLAPHYYLVKR